MKPPVTVFQLAHRVLVRTSILRTSPSLPGRVWRRVQQFGSRRWDDQIVRTTLHGRSVYLNFGNPYPFFVRQFPTYNAPQVEAVLLAADVLRRPVRVVDVGAAVGDTALLLLERCPLQLERIDCVEGEGRFFALLEVNLRGTVAVAHFATLSDIEGDVPELVRTQHQGTASAVGESRLPAVTLDQIIDHADVIKVDTDGYDGLILAGSKRLLSTKPMVLFEWHPLLCAHVGTDERVAFNVLGEIGYDRFVFCNKFGEFSQFMTALDQDRLNALAQFCLTSKTAYDWHFDVLALGGPDVDLISVAGLERRAIRVHAST